MVADEGVAVSDPLIIIFGSCGSSGKTNTRLATRSCGSFLSGKPVIVILSPIASLEKPYL